MMEHHSGRHALYEELLRRLAAALRSVQLYAREHPLNARTTAALLEALQHIHAHQPSITIGLVGLAGSAGRPSASIFFSVAKLASPSALP